METLRKGSRGEAVKTLQKALHLIADGIFGTITEEAVMDFQRRHGLVADGIVGAKTWAALTPGELLKKSSRRITGIILHCTATREGQEWTVGQIRQMHINERGWSDIGYHYVVYLDGSVHEGRPIDKVGAHCSGQNAHTIGVVYVGGLDKDGKPKDTRTPEQKQAMRELVMQLCKLHGLDPKRDVHGHNEFAAKACPCFDVRKEYRL